MKIETSWISKATGKKVFAYYEDSDDFSKLPQDKIKSICAFCYYDGKFVMVKNEGRWEPVAGHVEKEETPEEALIREIKEESNMKVLRYFPMNYQYERDQDFYQTRYFCLVEPYGPFLADPDGGVTEIKLLKTDEMFDTLGWKDTSEPIKARCLEIISNIDKKQI